jgi:hypothetical protein
MKKLFVVLIFFVQVAFAQIGGFGISSSGGAAATDTLWVGFSDTTFAVPALGAYGSDTGAVLAGTIDGVGAGYTEGDTLTIAQVGSDSLAKIVVSVTVGAISSFGFATRGSDYVNAAGVALTGGTGAGGTIQITSVADGTPDSADITVAVAGIDVSKLAAVGIFADGDLTENSVISFAMMEALTELYWTDDLRTSEALPVDYLSSIIPSVNPKEVTNFLRDEFLIVSQNYGQSHRLVITASELDADGAAITNGRIRGEPLIGLNSGSGFLGYNYIAGLLLKRIWLEPGIVKMRVQHGDPALAYAGIEDLKLLVLQMR